MGKRILEKFIDNKFADHEKRDDDRFEALNRAIGLAATELKSRLDHDNKIREQLDTYTRTTFTREEFREAHEPVLEELQRLRDFKTEMGAKASQTAVYVAWAFSFLAVLVQVIEWFTRK